MPILAYGTIRQARHSLPIHHATVTLSEAKGLCPVWQRFVATSRLRMTESSGQLHYARFSLAAQDRIQLWAGREQFRRRKGGQRADHRRVRPHTGLPQRRDERQVLRHPVGKQDRKDDQARLRTLSQRRHCVNVLIGAKVNHLGAQPRALQCRCQGTGWQLLLAQVFDQKNIQQLDSKALRRAGVRASGVGAEGEPPTPP